MAKRKKIGQALAAASQTFGDIMRLMLQQQQEEKMIALREASQRRLQTEDDERQRETARMAQEAAQKTNALGRVDPFSARGAGLKDIGGVPIEALLPSQEKIAGDIFGEMTKATNPTQLGSPTLRRNQFLAQGGENDPMISPMGSFNPPTIPGIGEVVALPKTDTPSPLHLMIQALQSQRGTMFGEEQEAGMAAEHYNPLFRNKEKVVRGQTIPTGPTPFDQGQNNLMTALQGELSPDWARAQGEKEAEIEAITRPGAVTRAGEIAQATASGVSKGTMGDARGASFVPRLVAAGAQASELESRGFGLESLSEFSESPLFQQLNSKVDSLRPGLGMSPETMNYYQSAVNWINLYGLITSGVTVRPDEYGRYLKNFFVSSGEPYETKKQKQTARQIFEEASTIAARGELPKAADILRSAIERGLITPEQSQFITHPQLLQLMQRGGQQQNAPLDLTDELLKQNNLPPVGGRGRGAGGGGLY